MNEEEPFEIEIEGKSLGEATVDLDKFRGILEKTWNLERAVKESVKITRLDGRFRTEQFLKSIWLGIDWGKIIDVFNEIDDREMHVKWYKARYKNWRMYSPGAIDRSGRKFVINEEMKDGEEMILIQSFRKDVAFNLKNFIDNCQFSYAFNKWELDMSDELLGSGGKGLNNK